MYELIEISLADTQRLLSYKRDLDLEIHLNVKGFDNTWKVETGGGLSMSGWHNVARSTLRCQGR